MLGEKVPVHPIKLLALFIYFFFYESCCSSEDVSRFETLGQTRQFRSRALSEIGWAWHDVLYGGCVCVFYVWEKLLLSNSPSLRHLEKSAPSSLSLCVCCCIFGEQGTTQIWMKFSSPSACEKCIFAGSANFLHFRFSFYVYLFSAPKEKEWNNLFPRASICHLCVPSYNCSRQKNCMSVPRPLSLYNIHA